MVDSFRSSHRSASRIRTVGGGDSSMAGFQIRLESLATGVLVMASDRVLKVKEVLPRDESILTIEEPHHFHRMLRCPGVHELSDFPKGTATCLALVSRIEILDQPVSNPSLDR